MKISLSIMFGVQNVLAAGNLFFVENSATVPGNVNLWKFDGENATKVTNLDKTGTHGFVSAATICNGIYVGAWDIFPTSFGLGVVDITSGETHLMETDKLIHAVACHPTLNDTVFTVGSVPGDKHAHFSVETINLKTGNESVIGQFPIPRDELFEGYDTIFQFSDDRSEVYGAFGKQPVVFPYPSSSVLFVLDTTTGQLKGEYTLGDEFTGPVYTIFSGLERAITFIQSDTKVTLKWADVKCLGKKCSVKSTGDDTIEWSAGKPFAVCGDDAFAIQKFGGQPQPLYHSTISSGATTKLADLTELNIHGEAGGLAIEC